MATENMREMLYKNSKAKMGSRKAVLIDLSTFAAFISHNYNYDNDIPSFVKEAEEVVDEVKKKYGWMYEVIHTDTNGKVEYGIDGQPLKGTVNYFVWSDAHICPHCSEEFVFWDVAVDAEHGRVIEPFKCPHCGASLKK